MVAGRSGITRITKFDVEGAQCQVGGEVKGLDAGALLGKREIRRLGVFMQYAMIASDEALADAGYARGKGPWPEANRFGVYVGSGFGGTLEVEDNHRTLFKEGMAGVSAYALTMALINLAAGQLAIRYVARGPSLVVATACATGNHSIGEAFRLVRSGDADVVIAGGTEAPLCPSGFASFMSMRAMSRRNDDPATASRPFDRDRDGFVMGEGAGILVVEDAEHARRRGARIYCEIVGYAMTTDAHHITAPAPDGEGAARCMALALAGARLRPEEVQHVNAHGTSTPANDPSETAAIRTVFGAHAASLLVSGTKGVTGHLLGAAGGVEAVATAKALETGLVPPTANLANPDPQCDLDYVAGGARQANPQVAISNAFGFGGTNATLVLRRWDG